MLAYFCDDYRDSVTQLSLIFIISLRFFPAYNEMVDQLHKACLNDNWYYFEKWKTGLSTMLHKLKRYIN